MFGPSRTSRRIAAAALFLLLAGFNLSESANAAPVNEPYQGKIAAVSDKGITLVGKGGDNIAFLLATDCAITFDGKPVEIGKLAVGQLAKITAVNQGTDKIAKRIEVHTSE